MKLPEGPKNLIQGNVPRALKEEFDAQRELRDWKVQKVVEIMASLWILLGEDNQYALTKNRIDLAKLAILVDQHITDSRAAAKELGDAQAQASTRKQKKKYPPSTAG